MIRFSCPSCRKLYDAPQANAGQKFDCACGQRVQVPAPPQTKTVLGKIEGVQAAPPALPPFAEPVGVDGQTEAGARGRKRLKRVLVGVAVAVVLSLIVFIIVLVSSLRRAERIDAANNAQLRPDPRLPEERLVQKHILETANDAKSIEFLKWGPHLFEGENWPKLAFNPTGKPARLVRVTLRGKNEFGALVFTDLVFGISDGKVLSAAPNVAGDEWRERATEAMNWIIQQKNQDDVWQLDIMKKLKKP